MDELGEDELRVDLQMVEDSIAVIRLCGDVDIAGVDAVRAAITSAVETGARDLVFDLDEVAFIDSSGLAVLIEARALAATVSLRRPSLAVTRLIATTGLAHVLAVEP